MNHPMLALIFKELRSLSRFIALALLADVWLLNEMTGARFGGTRPAVSGLVLVRADWLICFGFVAAGIASLLGLAMSLDDGLRGTWPFALFRPISRRAYVGVKLLVGGVLTWLLVALPVAGYSVWVTQSESLWRWSLLQPAIEACGWSVVVFLGAFLSGIRPAKWWWSRLWPLGGTVVLGLWFWLASQDPNSDFEVIVPSPSLYWGLCVGMSALLVVSILSVVEERDFA